MDLQLIPRGPLRLFVQRLWFSEGAPLGTERERVLPTGAMHLAIRLDDEPLHIYASVEAATGQAIGTAVIGGARAEAYVRDVSRPVRSVGAMLAPGASLPLFGVPADELAHRHTALADVWGREVDGIRDRLRGLDSPRAQLIAFEAILAARLPRIRGIHPAVAHALGRFDASCDVRSVVDEVGYSHHRFITLFREAVGLTPKRYCRVLRFHRAVERLGTEPAVPWSELALEAGYSDQAHFVREFHALSGVTPTTFRKLAPRHAHHVPVQFPSRRG
ncbi:MAG TPA: AraC family transcriptional regulator [Kofleriaceae bacterium]